MMKRARRMQRQRRGSAILLCTLAAAILSLAAIAIVRSSRHHIAHTHAHRSSVDGHHISDGLAQRCVAILRADPNATGRVTDPNITLPDAYAELNLLSPTMTQIRVFLYAGSTIPALDTIVDPATL